MKGPDGELFRALYQAYPDAVLVVDAAGRILQANPAATTLLGYSNTALLALTIEALVPERVVSRHAAHRQSYALAPKSRPMGTELELAARRADGSEVLVEIALSPMRGDHADLVVAAVRDIGAYPRVRRAMQRARYNEHVVQLGRLAVDTVDPHALLQRMPAVAADALAVERVAVYLLTPDGLEFTLAGQVGPAGDADARWPNRPNTALGYVVAQGRSVIVSNYAREQRFESPAASMADGAQSSLAVPLTDRGKTVGVLGAWSAQPRRFGEEEQAFVESLANLLSASMQRAQTEANLRHVQRLETVGQLTGGIAHDFNNLLTVVQGNLQILAEHPALAREPLCVELLGAAQRAGRRGAELTGKLLAFSRRQSLTPRAVDPVVMVDSLAGMLRRTIGSHIRVEAHGTRPCPPCLADPVQLESALLNVAVNARDAMPQGGVLALHCHAITQPVADGSDVVPSTAQRTMVCFTIRDSGTGMSDTVRERAFEPFFTTKEAGRGTGLGLATVYGFANQSGGSVHIDSAPGAGTMVTLMLPAIETRPGADGPGSAGNGAGALAGLRVLLVEDDADVRQVSASFLGAIGCTVSAQPDARAALAQLNSPAAFDLLFTDVALGDGVDGVELARLARELRPGLRVLLASGYAQRAHDASASTALPLLTKPFSREQLAAAIALAMDPATG